MAEIFFEKFVGYKCDESGFHLSHQWAQHKKLVNVNRMKIIWKLYLLVKAAVSPVMVGGIMHSFPPINNFPKLNMYKWLFYEWQEK